MELLKNLFEGYPNLWGGGVAHSVLILSLVIAFGIMLGKIKISGISLGVTWILFVGIVFGHFNLNLDEHLLHFLKEFGLILFVYSIGLQVGPGFFSAFKKGGFTLNMLAMGAIFISVVITIILHFTTGTPITTMVGILSGAVTNTPGLGAAQQANSDLNGIDAPEIAMKVCQNAHLLFLCTKPRLSQAGALLLPKDFVSLSITFYTMTKIHFRPYNPNQTVLFPPRIDEDIAEHDPVRMVDALVESLTLESFRKLYKECGRSPYHPRMMLKVILYAYMNNIYSCRKIEKLLHRDIHYIWLAGYEKPDFITINRFRNRVKNEINEVFTQTVLLLSSKGFISLNVEYIDGTKIESKANKYTFVWRKTVERNRERLMKKIHILLGQIDNVIAQENSSESNEEIEFTPAMLTEMAGELRQALEQVPEPSTKEEKTALKKKRKQLKELEEHRDKLQEYDNRLDTLQDRNSYSKTDNDATFMRMKEDAMRNGQTKPGYNLQIGTGNQFITDFALFPNPTDTLTLIPFLQSFSSRYDRLAHTVVADSGYGSEENYRFMSENGMEAYVKYNYFHMEQRPRFKPDPFKAENFYYNEEQDFCICPMGQKMQRIGTRHVKTASGYVSENARYRAIRCEGCPLRCRCFKAKGNRTIELNHRLRKYKQKAKELLCSEEGLKHRGQRCIEPEAVFGQMKNNMNYKRFRHFGKDKVFMDFAFFAIAFNIKKMCAKMTKEGMDWLIRPFYELTVVLFRCCERINQRNPQNIAA